MLLDPQSSESSLLQRVILYLRHLHIRERNSSCI